MIWLEWCDKVFQRDGTFLLDTEVLVKTGFRSVYGFKEKPISSKGLNKYPVYSDTLFMDFDDGLGKGFKSAVQFMKDNLIKFEAFSSGSKGGHLHVAILPMFGEGVPFSQREFVKGLECSADISLYRHSSLIRLPGTVHDKTGNAKTKLDGGDGCMLEIEYMNPPKFSNVVVSDDNLLHMAFNRLTSLINHEPASGTRTLTIWSVAKNLSDAGFNFDTTLDIVQRVNETWKQPKEDSEVLRAVREAFYK